MESTNNPSQPAPPVKPVAPIAPYVGGKRLLAKHITKLIEAVPHTCYAEPFVGMGGIFLRRRQQPQTEVINDFNGEVANLFRILQRHYPQFMEIIRFSITSRKRFVELSNTDPTTLTDLERAARFLYLQRTAFGGKPSAQHFGVATERPARFNMTTLAPMLEDVHERMAGVVIECLDFEAFIRRYDRPYTLFYLDPPYWDCEDYYGPGLFNREDFSRLASILAGIKGRFILSLNDTEGVRDCFKGFDIQPVQTKYSLAGKGYQDFREVIIRN